MFHDDSCYIFIPCGTEAIPEFPKRKKGEGQGKTHAGENVEIVLCPPDRDLESQEEDAPKRILWFKPMTWLGTDQEEEMPLSA
jgi:hypothetical protein